MVKRRGYLALLPLILLFIPMTAKAEELGEVRVEQVQTMLPWVHVYIGRESQSETVSGEALQETDYAETGGLQGKGGEITDFTAALEDRKLSLQEAEKITESKIPTDYYILVDCSTSTTEAQMQAVKKVLRGFGAGLTEEETITLLAFGTGVEIVLTREKEQSVIEEGIEKLTRDKKGTVFLDAIAKATELAGGKEEALNRKIAFVFSDSVEVNKGGYTKEEINEVLSGGILPFYAFGFDTGTKEGLDQFGAVARQSGGSIKIVSEQSMEAAFKETTDQIGKGMVYRFQTETNLVTPGVQTLTLRADNGKEIEKKLKLRYWEPDMTIPVITEVNQTTAKSIEMIFSEPVQGAQFKENYSIRLQNGDLLAIEAVTYIEEERKARLSLGTETDEEEIEIILTSITDLSMEKNPVTNPTTMTLQGVEGKAKQESDEMSQPGSDKDELYADREGETSDSAAFFLLTVVSVAMIAGITVTVIKKRGGVVRHEGKLHFGNDVTVVEEMIPREQVKVHVADQPLPVLHLYVSAEGRESRELRVPINGAVFVGRSEICEVYFDDEGMSRQHFVIEQTAEGFLITNLSKTNGTLVNGIRINQPRILSDGDQIEAGMYRFLVYFEGRFM